MEKIVFVSGPGDVVGTYRHWRDGRPDPRVPVRTYSSMFFDIVTRRGAQALVLHHHRDNVGHVDGRFTFQGVYRPAGDGKLGFAWSSMAQAFRLATQINRFKPDVVILSSHAPKLTVPLIRKGTRIIFSMHSAFWPMGQTHQGGWKSFVKRALHRFYLRNLNGAICTSEECRRQLKQVVGADIEARVEQPALAFSVAQYRQSDAARRLIFVGRIEENKGVFQLLEAFDKLAETRKGLSLTFVGDGNSLDALGKRVQASPNSGRIRVTGRLMAREVYGELLGHDLLICPTKSSFLEGLALVCIEAAAHGLPCVVSSVVPAQDFLSGSCRTYQADSVDALTESVADIVDDTEVYASLASEARLVGERLKDTSHTWGRELEHLLDETHHA